MFYHYSNDTGCVHEKASSIQLSDPNHKKAILLIQGFTGTTRELKYLGEKLFAEGYDIYIPRLPGHGTNGKDFQDSHWWDWLRRVNEAYKDLQANYETVHIGGLSMGGLLATILAESFNIHKVFLISPAFYAQNNSIYQTPLLQIALKKVKVKDPIPFYGWDKEFGEHMKDYWSYNYMEQVRSLLKLMGKAKKSLKNLTTEVEVVLSKADNAINISKVEKLLKEYPNIHINWLENSHHIQSDDTDKDKVQSWAIDYYNN